MLPIQYRACEEVVEVNYTDNILRDVVTRGIADSEIQLDLLGDKNQDMTLEEVFQFIEAKESGKRSSRKLFSVHGVEISRSQYHKKKQDEILEQQYETAETCSYCG